MPGIVTSRTITSGARALDRGERRAAVGRRRDRVALGRERALEHAPDRRRRRRPAHARSAARAGVCPRPRASVRGQARNTACLTPMHARPQAAAGVVLESAGGGPSGPPRGAPVCASLTSSSRRAGSVARIRVLLCLGQLAGCHRAVQVGLGSRRERRLETVHGLAVGRRDRGRYFPAASCVRRSVAEMPMYVAAASRTPGRRRARRARDRGPPCRRARRPGRRAARRGWRGVPRLPSPGPS